MHCIREAQRVDFRSVHDSVQSDHVHLIVEADDKQALSNGMKGLGCRVARTLNQLWRRSGKVFRERFLGSRAEDSARSPQRLAARPKKSSGAMTTSSTTVRHL